MYLFKKILVCGLLGLISISLYAQEDEYNTYNTKYGNFEIKRVGEYEPDTLYFNNKKVQPTVEGNNSLSIEGKFKIKQDYILLVQDNGGNGCPANFYFIKISNDKKPKVSPSFGTCSDLIKVKQKEGIITVTMPEFYASYKDSSGDIDYVRYTYNGQLVKKNGKIVN